MCLSYRTKRSCSLENKRILKNKKFAVSKNSESHLTSFPFIGRRHATNAGADFLKKHRNARKLQRNDITVLILVLCKIKSNACL